jgi:hypothetical protein
LNILDVTGYVQKGDNVLLMDFPFATGDKAFAARLIVEYFNSNRLDFSSDTSWLTMDSYYFPATYGDKPVYPVYWGTPKVAGVREEVGTPKVAGVRGTLARQSLTGFREGALSLPCDLLQGLNNVYMDVHYQGDRISVRQNGRLLADNLNNNTNWLMDLRRGDRSLECQQLQLEVRPWKDIGRMYFDLPPSASSAGKAEIGSVRLVPEYQAMARMSD